MMIYYAFCLLFMMCVRPFVSMKFTESKGTKSIYAALYFLPILIVIQAVLGGLLCKLNVINVVKLRAACLEFYKHHIYHWIKFIWTTILSF